MAINQAFIGELQHEAASTRKLLERIPNEQFAWQPHQKSMPLGRLATHIAELPGWITMTLNTNELNWDNFEYKPPVINSREDMVTLLDKNVTDAIEALKNATDEEMMKPWAMKRGGQTLMEMPKVSVIRTMAMNHLIHHRGQLTVYLRENDVPLPGIYGPTADEKN